ncbi:uncharacterized protein MYCFIDRAFT_172284 [Pseudocercospora fijiensis CIRAD86]|uniref:Uncharacterized protein n=1 Tax=Pseudocercospora fijiensis (strain CIRAD86) TaxID=383855 RepID=M3BB82_PSEFD|nr:uncharacterized protein MYCFIDRAFT_172284 [Pseudocercospora fijiensis CIRAD86]EME86562.1 hypothetical protein MYCFIDRAFT_172284 [Pseudocercospora fijiensis CIRAD86]
MTASSGSPNGMSQSQSRQANQCLATSGMAVHAAMGDSLQRTTGDEARMTSSRGFSPCFWAGTVEPLLSLVSCLRCGCGSSWLGDEVRAATDSDSITILSSPNLVSSGV